MSSIKIYLRNHEAAAQGGRALFHRAAQTQRTRPWASDLQSLANAIDTDVTSLRHIMRSLAVSPDRIQGLALRLGERVGRLKSNGHLLTRAPLSDLIEVEGLLDAVRAKQAGWKALEAAHILPATLEPLLRDLLDRADNQVTQLETVHQLTAKATLLQ